MVTFALLILCAGAIYASCEFFVNGIEWTAQRMHVGQTATGTVLAAFGTALPESAVTFMAVVMGEGPQKEIGVGAALGGPLVLATISYATVGIMLMLCAHKLGRANGTLQVNQQRLSRDQGWFLLIFACKIILGLVAFHYKPWTAILFLAAYALYVRKEMLHGDEDIDDILEPLKLQPRATNPALHWILLQTLGSLIIIGIASHYFVVQMEAAGPILGISPQLVALLLSPIATELPETMNAIIWLRQGKENLALANISGAMMIQATIPSAFGIFFTAWRFDTPLIAAGIITMLAIGVLFFLFRRGAVTGRTLAFVGLLYAVFTAFLWFY